MPYEKIGERIRVVADFKDGKILPYFFDWNGRRYKVSRVNLVHEVKEGRTTIYKFSLSTDHGEFLIIYNPATNNWEVEENFLD